MELNYITWAKQVIGSQSPKVTNASQKKVKNGHNVIKIIWTQRLFGHKGIKVMKTVWSQGNINHKGNKVTEVSKSQR